MNNSVLGDASNNQSTNVNLPETGSQFPQEADFFRQLQQQDEECWDTLLSLYVPQLRRDITRSLNKRQLPLEWLEDIEQETWLTAVRHIGNFVWENENRFYNWFRSIATNHIRNLERKLHSQYISIDAIDDDSDASGLSLDFFMYIHGLIDDSPETKLALRESLEVLNHAMQSLKSREREILLKRILYKEGISQLALEYGVKPATISVILVRAKQAVLAHITSMNH